jgi:hypothetical protein
MLAQLARPRRPFGVSVQEAQRYTDDARLRSVAIFWQQRLTIYPTGMNLNASEAASSCPVFLR